VYEKRIGRQVDYLQEMVKFVDSWRTVRLSRRALLRSVYCL